MRGRIGRALRSPQALAAVGCPTLLSVVVVKEGLPTITIDLGLGTSKFNVQLMLTKVFVIVCLFYGAKNGWNPEPQASRQVLATEPHPQPSTFLSQVSLSTMDRQYDM